MSNNCYIHHHNYQDFSPHQHFCFLLHCPLFWDNSRGMKSSYLSLFWQCLQVVETFALGSLSLASCLFCSNFIVWFCYLVTSSLNWIEMKCVQCNQLHGLVLSIKFSCNTIHCKIQHLLLQKLTNYLWNPYHYFYLVGLLLI